MNIFQDLTAFLATLKASPFSAANAFQAFLKLLNYFAEPKTFSAKPGEDCAAVGAECLAECNKVEGPDAVGKWGDGKMLELFKLVLPLILKFLV